MNFFSSYNFGCRVNQAELNKINRELTAKGYIYNKNNPDFIIINSCAVTQKAEREVRQLIYQLTRKYPQAKIYLTGCAATLDHIKGRPLYIKVSPLIKRITNSQKQNLTKIITKKFNNKHLAIKPCNHFNSQFLNSGRYLLKIQDGCHRFCSYCIVPYLRGKPKSKTIKDIIDEINSFSQFTSNSRGGLQCPPSIRRGTVLAPSIMQEIILTAINTEDFGRENKETLTDLLKAVLSETTIPRISFGSINPWSLTDDLINIIRCHLALQGDTFTKTRLSPFFHIPLQSGSNKILKLMNRGYTTEEIKTKLEKLYQINPFALIATDIIVGFPGETEEDFQKTLDFIKTSPISKVHIFPFSSRPDTKAYEMVKSAKKIKPEVLISRLSDLRNLSNLKFSSFQKSLLGLTLPALFLEKKIGNYQEALLNNQVPIWVKTKKDLKGEIKELLIQYFQKEKVFGKIYND